MQEREPKRVNPGGEQITRHYYPPDGGVGKKTRLEQALKRRINFLNDAEGDGAHRKVPIRKLFVVVLLTRNPFIKETDLALHYKVTRERIRQIHNEGMELLWRNAKEDTQKKFPLKSILGARKPLSLHNEVDLPREFRFTTLKKKLEEEKEDKKVQAILDSVPSGSLKGHLVRHKGDTFTTLGRVLKNAGFYMGPSVYKREKIEDLIRNVSIPMRLTRHKSIRGQQTYYIVLIRDRQRIINALNKQVRLRRFKHPIEPISVGDSEQTFTGVQRFKKRQIPNIRQVD